MREKQLTRALQRQPGQVEVAILLDAGGVAGGDGASHHCERGQNAVGRLEPMVTGSADAEGFERVADCFECWWEILHTVRISIRSHKLMSSSHF